MKHYYLGTYEEMLELVSQYETLQEKKTNSTFKESSYLKLIDHFENEQSVDKALEIADQGLFRYKHSISLYARKAQLLLSSRLDELALETLDIAESHAKSSFEIDFLRSKAFCSLKKYEKALELLNDIKQNYFMSSEELSNIYFQKAFIFEKMEQFEDMFTTLKKSLTQNPNNKEALERMWICVELSKLHKDSIKFHDFLLSKNAYSFQAWFNIGHAYYSNCEYEKAIEAFEFAYLINDQFEFAYRDCAEVCMIVKNHKKALEAYLEMLENCEPDTDVLINIGKCYIEMDQHEKAKIYFFRALGMNARNDEIYFYIGECYSKELKWESAVYFYKQAIRLNENREDYVIALAITYYHIGKMAKAYPLFCQATEMAPEQNALWVQLACFLIDNNRIDQAIAVLDQAEETAYAADMLYTRAICYFQKNNSNKAITILGEALQENFDGHKLVFEFMPHLREDPNIKAILKYYGS